MAPPTQAGRFKPRKKAANKITIGATVGAPPLEPVSSSISQPNPGRGRGGTGGRGGPGRGGGRGGRIPIQQGPSFFGGATNNNNNASQSKKLNTQQRGKQMAGTAQEEIIILGEPTANNTTSATATRPDTIFSSRFEERTTNATETYKPPPAAYEYDSDSSSISPQDQDTTTIHSNNDNNNNNNIQTHSWTPIVLPIPSPTTTTITTTTATISQGKDTLDHGDDWSLWQLPTRLSASMATTNLVPSNNQNTYASVIVPPVLPETFDNSLIHKTGRLGTLQITASGKQRLVLDDGTTLMVAEGVASRQIQHAVSFQTSTCVPVGRVRKTYVAVPDMA